MRISRTAKFLLAGAALVLLFCVGVIIYAIWPFLTGGRGVDSDLAAMKARGEPTTLAELAPPPVPESQNAASIYSKAFGLLAKARQGRTLHELAEFVRASDKPLDDEAWARARKTTSELTPVIAVAEKAVARPKCRFNVDWSQGFGADFTYCGRLRDVASVVAASAMIDARDGRIDRAIQRSELCLRISGALSDDPALTPMYSRVAILRSGTRALRYAVQRGGITQAQAQRIDDLLSRIDLSDQFVRALQGERALGISFFDQMRKKGLNAFSEMADDRAGAAGSGSPSGRDRPVNMPGRSVLRFIIGPDERCYIRLMNRQIQDARRPYRESATKQPESAKDDDLPRYAIFSRLLALGVRPSRGKAARDVGTAVVDLTRVMLALETYRSRFRAYPDSLQELPAKLGRKLPVDIFSGHNFVYKRLDRGFLLYSIGPNLKDEGGLVVVASRNSRGAVPEGDIVWRIER